MKKASAVFLITLSVILGTFLVSCQGKGEETALQIPEKPPLAVDTVTVGEGKLISTIEAAGIVSGIHEAFIVSQTQGIIEEVLFELGDIVEEDQVLLKVDDRIAFYTMEQAKGQYETAALDLELTEKLFNDGRSSKAQLARAQSTANGARALYEMAAKTYEDSAIKSPFKGSIAQKDSIVELGNYITPGMPIGRVVDISSLKLEIAVSEREIGYIKEGTPANVRVPAACSEIFQGTVEAAAAGSDPGTGSYAVLITWPNGCDENIKSGMSSTVSIATTEEEAGLIIPSTALLKSGSREYVFIHQEGAARRKEVVSGRSIGNKTEILKGLNRGEELIISGLTSLSDGDAVTAALVGESGSWQ